MSTYEFKLPDIGEGVTEGEIVKWLVTPGDPIREDQPMVEVMTDKATVTITSPKSGTVKETRGAVGAVVPVHSVLVVFDLSDADASRSAEPAQSDSKSATKSEGPAATAVGDIKEDLPGMSWVSAQAGGAPKAAHKNGAALEEATYFNAKPLATPATRKLARDLEIDLRRVSPTGAAGRVTTLDVRRIHEGGAPISRAAPASATSSTLGLNSEEIAARQSAQSAPASSLSRPSHKLTEVHSSNEDERIPLRGVRKRIFEGMSRSKHTAAHFTFVEECDVTNLKSLRERMKPAAEAQGVKLTFLPFFVKAVVAALKKTPSLNSAFDEVSNEIVVRKRLHIGIAAATDAGLIVPVVKDADRKSILEIARDIARLGEDAKNGKSRAEDLSGSTFTITSLGSQGGLFATPILNHPEVGILGIHQMKEKPVVRDGQIVIGNVMLLSLSFDHRIIDGHVGAKFAYDIIGFLEDTDRLFLEMS